VSFVFLSAFLNAQRFDGGIKAGIVASEVSGDELAGPNKLGFFAGVYTNREISEYSKFQLELSYISKGSRGIPSENQPRNYKLNLGYAETSLFFIHNLKKYSSQSYIQKMSAEVGLSFGVLVNYFESQDGFEIDLSQNRPFYGYEGNIWAGFYLPINDNLNFNLRYSNSITPIRKHQSGIVVWYNWGQYHSLWTFGFEYTF